MTKWIRKCNFQLQDWIITHGSWAFRQNEQLKLTYFVFHMHCDKPAQNYYWTEKCIVLYEINISAWGHYTSAFKIQICQTMFWSTNLKEQSCETKF